jgi:hypothetical protein
MGDCEMNQESSLVHINQTQAQKITEQQAEIEMLRLTLEHYAKEDIRNARHYPPEFAKDALAATPESSLREHDAKLVERIAKELDAYSHNQLIDIADKIRKGEFELL